MHSRRVVAFALPVIATFALAIIIIISVVPSCTSKIDFSAKFYYVCYNSPNNAQSAASVSGVVHSYGGAGYIVEKGGNYYVTVSCYYNEKDANTVCANLNNKGLACAVMRVQTGSFTLPSSAKDKAEIYSGTLKTMYSLTVMCYDLANGMDSGEYTQTSAKSLLGEVRTGLQSLYNANQSNCFTQEISALLAECDDASHGYVFSYDVRRLQIAIADSIIHAQLY